MTSSSYGLIRVPVSWPRIKGIGPWWSFSRRGPSRLSLRRCGLIRQTSTGLIRCRTVRHRWPVCRTSRMLKKSSSFVLASLRGSTYGEEYALPLRSLRPRRKAILNILQRDNARGVLLGGNASGTRVLILLVPGHLDGLQNFLVRLLGIVSKFRQRRDPRMHLGEPHSQRVGIRV